ncbi:MAG: DNA-binding protein, partial [Planctomycetota bacterium]
RRSNAMPTVLLKKTEVAEILRVSSRTIDRLRSVGMLRSTKIAGSVRFQLEEIERYIKKNTSKILRNDKDASNFNDSSN